MKPAYSLHLVLLTLSTSSYCAPIPLHSEKCVNSISCAPSFQTAMAEWQRPRQSQSIDPLQEPYFPPHQILPERQDDSTEGRILEHLISQPKIVIPTEFPSRMRNLNAATEVVIDDPFADPRLRTSRPQTISIKTTHSSTSLPAINLEALRGVDINSDESTLVTSILERIRAVTSHPAQSCHKTGPMTLESNGGMTITYTYSYGYIRRDYTDMVVVGIVLLFLFVVVAVELLEKMVDTTKTIFGLDQGRIRLEDNESGHYVHVVRVDKEKNQEHESSTDEEKHPSC